MSNHQRMGNPHRALRAVLATLTVFVLIAAAAPVSWKEYKKGRDIMQVKKRAGLLFFEGGDEFSTQAQAKLFSSKTFTSKMKKVVPMRVESGAEEARELCTEYGVVPGTGAIVILDVEGERIARYSQDLDPKGIEENLKKAVEISKEKGKILTTLEKHFKAGQKGYKSKKYAVALRHFNVVMQIQEEKGELIKSPLFDEVDTAIDEIRAVARKQLDEATKFLEAKKYSKASSIARAVEKAFPDEMIQLQVKGLLEAIQQKQLDEYKGR
ncbi:MAG: hypothetical protein O6952_01445 [Planctomycetota bacterium]|nr:hypothetical protein [Planctomycetota bacterium]